jgi:sulfite reductase alpha subunit-like flavoprotein
MTTPVFITVNTARMPLWLMECTHNKEIIFIYYYYFYFFLLIYYFSSFSRQTYDAKNPYLSPIAASRELFTSNDRNCLHMELDITGSGIHYETGDHVAIWPMNAEGDVYRLLKVLGLWEKRDTVISIESTDRKC